MNAGDGATPRGVSHSGPGDDVASTPQQPRTAILSGVIGRLSDSDLVLNDPMVSGRHAELRRDEGQPRIVDLNSRNGVCVNGVRVSDAPLSAGDVVLLGATQLTFDGTHLVAPDHPVDPTQSPTASPGPDEATGAHPAVAGSPVIVIGRDPAADLVLDDPMVSGRHAELRTVDGIPRIVDLSSRNGIFLDGARVQDAPLTLGSVVLIGSTTLVFDGTRLVTEAASPDTTTGGAATSANAGSIPSAPQIAAATRDTPTAVHRPRERISVIGRSDDAALVLNEPTVSREHARLIFGGPVPILEDAGSANGTFVNGMRIDRRALSVGDVVQIGPFVLGFDGRRLVAVDEAPTGFRLDAVGLGVRVGDVPLLSGVNLTILPNDFVALVGGSGAGKSTLLTTLCGARAASNGAVLYNGTDLAASYAALRPVIGYVPQTEVLHHSLPVDRALMYTARLRLPPDLGDAEREERIAAALELVGMLPFRHRRIDTLSGGQRKRVSVAAELLANPRVIFLDEPTSGLDPGLDRRLMGLFRDLADQGRTVVLVTHTTENIDLCDRVCFLAPGGRVAYVGAPRDALGFFDVDSYVDCYLRIEDAPDDAVARFEQIVPPPPPLQTPPELKARPAARPALAQFGLLVSRYVELWTRDRRAAAFLLLQAPLIGLALLLVVPRNAWHDGYPVLSSKQMVGFALAAVAVWFGLINAAREISKERPLVHREQMAGVRAGPYVLSKFVPLAVLLVLQCVCLIGLVTIKTGLPTTATMLSPFVEVLITVALAGAASLALALLVSALVRSDDAAVTLVPYLLIPQFLLGGVAFHLAAPANLLERLTFTYWATRALAVTTNVCDPKVISSLGGACSGKVGIAPPMASAVVLTSWAVLGGAAIVLLGAAVWAVARNAPGPSGSG